MLTQALCSRFRKGPTAFRAEDFLGQGKCYFVSSQSEIHKGAGGGGGVLNVTTQRMQEKLQASSWLADLWEGHYGPLRLPRGGSPGILQDSQKENPVSSGLGFWPRDWLVICQCSALAPSSRLWFSIAVHLNWGKHPQRKGLPSSGS